jgi:glycosyltransferase involved in cell wall biosynthesis
VLTGRYGIRGGDIDVVHEFIEKIPSERREGDGAAARRELGIPENALIIGASGAEFWRKGRDLVVHLLLELQKAKAPRPVCLLWVDRAGTAEEEYGLRYDLQQAGVDSMYFTTGEVSNPLHYFSAFDIFALLSRDDPFPLVCLEAAALGIPIICFENAGGIPELVETDCGFTIPYLDVSAMAEKILLLARQPELRQALGAAGRAKVATRYTAETGAPKLLGVIEALLGQGRSAPQNR